MLKFPNVLKVGGAPGSSTSIINVMLHHNYSGNAFYLKPVSKVIAGKNISFSFICENCQSVSYLKAFSITLTWR